MSTASVVIPPDVAGTPLADQVRAQTYPGMAYQCITCHQRGEIGDSDGPVTIQVHLYANRTIMVVQYLHLGCGTGSVILHQAGNSPTLPSEGVAVPCLVLCPYSTRPWPALLVELRAQLTEVAPRRQDDSSRDLVICGLLTAGMALVSNIAFPPQRDNSWQVQLPGAGEAGSIRGPSGLVLLEPLNSCKWPAGWALAAASRSGCCAVYYVGRVGLVANVCNATSPDLARRAINRAATAGQVVGVVAEVRWPPTRNDKTPA